MKADEAKRLRQLETENARLKKLLAEAELGQGDASRSWPRENSSCAVQEALRRLAEAAQLCPPSATSPALLRRTIVTMVVLREFLYRRDDLVAQFLQQLEGGEYDEERIKDQRTRTSGASASAGIGSLGLSGERRADGTSETELTMRQTAASRFNRLHALLHQNEAIQPLHALDDAIWEQIPRNEVVEVEATLTLLPGVAEMHQVAGIGAVLPLIETIKDLPDELLPDTVDRREADKMSSQIPAMQAVAQGFASGPVPCTFVPAGSLGTSSSPN